MGSLFCADFAVLWACFGEVRINGKKAKYSNVNMNLLPLLSVAKQTPFYTAKALCF